MGDDVKEKLRELIRTQGKQILHDKNKFTSLMLDLCLGTNRREINILATALSEKIPQDLLYCDSKSLTRELKANLSSRLENETGLNTNAANWAVITWAEALGMLTGENPEIKDTEKQGTPSELKDSVQIQPEASPVAVLDRAGRVNAGNTIGPAKNEIKVKTYGRPRRSLKVWLIVSGIVVVIAIAAIAGSLFFQSKDNGNAVQEHLAAGQNYYDQKQWEKAIAEFSKAIDLNPNLARAYGSRGDAYSSEGQFDRAIADYTVAIELDPNNDTAYLDRGNAYDNKSEYSKAIADYTSAVTLNPKLAEAYNNRGYVYFETGDYNRAITDYTMAIELNRNYAEAYYNRAYAHDEKGEFDEAIADYNIAIAINPNDPDAYINRGHVYEEKGKYDEAINDYTRAIELDPRSASSYYNRGLAYQKLGELGKAEDDFNKAKELSNPPVAPTPAN
jgi:tetratricopeptide (TPR) repeat protein